MKRMGLGALARLAAVVLLGTSACGTGVADAPSEGDPQESTLGAISGDVVANGSAAFAATTFSARGQPLANGIPVPGAECTLEGTNRSGIADENGHFVIEAIEPGSYLLLCKATAQSGEVFAWLSAVEVEAGVTTSLGVLELRLTGRIVGQGHLSGQSSHAGIEVALLGASYSATTNAAGDYTIDQVPVGTYTLRFSRQGFASAEIPNVAVLAGETLELAPIELGFAAASGTLSFPDAVMLGEPPLAAQASRQVRVQVNASSQAFLMKLSQDFNFIGAEWQPIVPETTWTFDYDGWQVLYAKFTTDNGLESSPYAAEIVIDTEAPGTGDCGFDEPEESACGEVYVAKVVCDPDCYFDWVDATNVLEVRLDAYFWDETGVGEARFSNDGDFTGATWQPIDEDGLFTWTLAEGPDGERQAYIEVRDRLGQVTGPVPFTVVVDRVAPIIEDVFTEISYDGWTNIEFEINESGTAFVDYGPTAAYGSRVEGWNGEVWLPALLAGTYHYRLTAADEAGNLTEGEDATFEIAPLEIDFTSYLPSLYVYTNRNTSTVFAYGPTPELGTLLEAEGFCSGDTRCTNHTYQLTGLTPGTWYFGIEAEDSAGNTASFDGEIEIVAPAVEVSGTSIDAFNGCLVVGASLAASARAVLEWGPTTAYGETIDSLYCGTMSCVEHAFQVDDLVPGTYHYRFQLTDVQGNEAVSEDNVFVLEAPGLESVDMSVLGNIADLNVQAKGPSQIVLDYGPTTDYGTTIENGCTGCDSAYFVLVELSAATTYYYRLSFTDVFGNTSASTGELTTGP